MTCLKEQAPRLAVVIAIDQEVSRQGNSSVDLLLGHAAYQLIDEPTHLAHVSRCFRQALLAGIQFLQDNHRQMNVVFVKAEDRSGIVHQDICIEHEYPAALFVAHFFVNSGFCLWGTGCIKGHVRPPGLPVRVP